MVTYICTYIYYKLKRKSQRKMKFDPPGKSKTSRGRRILLSQLMKAIPSTLNTVNYNSKLINLDNKRQINGIIIPRNFDVNYENVHV